MARNEQAKRYPGYPHSGVGHGASNAIVFIIMMIVFLGGVYSFTFFYHGWWSFALGIGLFGLTYFIPQTFLWRPEKKRRELQQQNRTSPQQ